MNFDIDDIWLDKLDGLGNFTLIQKRRLYRVIMVCAVGVSYLIDTLLLGLFSAAGTIDSSVPLYYGSAALGHITLFSILQWSGFSERFSNPHMTVWQMTYAILVQMLGITISPQLTQFYLGIMFIIFTFGTLRNSIKQTLIVWFFTCLAVTITLALYSKSNLSIITPSKWEVTLVGIAFATILLRCISLVYYAKAIRMKLSEITHSLEQAATYDTLTGTLNRGFILPIIKEHINLFQRKQIVSCVAMIDIDKFKAINDTLGHVAGDAILKQLSSYIDSSIRDSDKLGRYGGEEFIMLLPATNIDECVLMMERVRENIACLAWQGFAKELTITISCGVAQIHDSDTLDELISRADDALYEAKKSGRNRVCRIN